MEMGSVCLNKERSDSASMWQPGAPQGKGIVQHCTRLRLSNLHVYLSFLVICVVVTSKIMLAARSIG